MAKSSRIQATRVSDILADVFSKSGIKRGMRRAEAVLMWRHVVGPDVAKFSEAKSLQDGILYVEVPDSETSMHLTLQRQKFLDVYKVKFKVQDIYDIRFRVGRIPEKSDKKKAPETVIHVDPKALAQLTKSLSELPEKLAQPTMQAARSMLAHRERKLAEGWQACRLCSALSETDICDACNRYKLETRVIRASEVLMENPLGSTPLLSFEERVVAIHLAKEKLKEKIGEMLPFVLADAKYKGELERASRAYLALTLSKAPQDLTDNDLDLLDGRVARALGRWK
jgi:Dna[CI] antecedent, DciA